MMSVCLRVLSMLEIDKITCGRIGERSGSVDFGPFENDQILKTTFALGKIQSPVSQHRSDRIWHGSTSTGCAVVWGLKLLGNLMYAI